MRFLDRNTAPDGDHGIQPAADDAEGGAHSSDAPTLPPQRTVVSTGFSDLDRLLGGGLKRRNLVVVASRADVGKSTLGLDFARAAAVKHNIPALVMTFVANRTDVLNRVMSAEAGVALHVLQSGALTDDDWTKLDRGLADIREAPLSITDASTPTLRHVVAEIRRAVAKFDTELVIIDPVQALSTGDPTIERFQELAEISRELQQLEMELGITVVLLCQLDPPPAGLRPDRYELQGPSAALEPYADVLIYLHRDDLYDQQSPRNGEADIIVAQHRDGPTGTVPVAAQLDLCRFVDMAL